MKEHQTETLYRKVGRKYIPVAARWYEDGDQMAVGTFRLTYAYKDGGRRYEYDVTPDTAGAVAALMIARQAMEESIHAASQLQPSSSRPYSSREKELIEQFRSDMGGMMPLYWSAKTAWEISEAAVKAVREFRP